ncbi:MAG: hypothetical protein AAB592_03725 [Patescibacteria group bacterium]
MLSEFFYRNYLEESEQVYLVVHRHLFIVFKKFFKIIFLGMVIPLGMWLLFPGLWIVSLVWAWFGLKVLVYQTLKWYYDAWLITDSCIVVIDWKGFFDKSTARIEYHYVDEVGYEIKGFIRTIFNYGSITVVRSTGVPITFDGTWKPKDKIEVMMKFQDQFITKKNFRDHKNLKQMLSDMLHLHQVKGGIGSTLDEK